MSDSLPTKPVKKAIYLALVSVFGHGSSITRWVQDFLGPWHVKEGDARLVSQSKVDCDEWSKKVRRGGR